MRKDHVFKDRDTMNQFGRHVNTLMFQLTLCFLIIIISMFVLVWMHRVYCREADRINVNLEMVVEPYTKLYGDLENVSSLMADTRPTHHTRTRIEASKSAAEVLLGDAESVMNILNADGYNRSSIDLYHTTQAYVELNAEVVNHYSKRAYADAIGGIERMRTMEKWIRKDMIEIGNILNDAQESSRVQSAMLRDAYNKRMAMMILLILSMCIIALALTMQRAVQPIKRLCKVVTDFRLSDDPKRLRESGVPCRETSLREIRTLATAIYSMQDTVLTQYTVEKHNEQLQQRLNREALRAEQMGNQLKETQLKALQAQINPHFLFNTLNMIAQLSYIEGAEHTTELLETFSEYFRYNVEKFGSSVTIAEEIANVRGYIHLQKERFGDRIHYELEMDDDLNDVKVPCLVVQPLVENAISHGLRMKTEDGLIRVSVQRCEDGGFDISVSDNGCGMSVEVLNVLVERAMDQRTDDESSHRSIGISNVIKRMRIAFGDRMRFHIDSREGEGTCITLHVEGGIA